MEDALASGVSHECPHVLFQGSQQKPRCTTRTGDDVYRGLRPCQPRYFPHRLSEGSCGCRIHAYYEVVDADVISTFVPSPADDRRRAFCASEQARG